MHAAVRFLRSIAIVVVTVSCLLSRSLAMHEHDSGKSHCLNIPDSLVFSRTLVNTKESDKISCFLSRSLTIYMTRGNFIV